MQFGGTGFRPVLAPSKACGNSIIGPGLLMIAKTLPDTSAC